MYSITSNNEGSGLVANVWYWAIRSFWSSVELKRFYIRDNEVAIFLCRDIDQVSAWPRDRAVLAVCVYVGDILRIMFPLDG